MNNEQLVTRFQAEMESIVERERELGLCPTRFIEGVRRYGGVGYARRLLDKAESDLPPNTFTWLRKQGRLDLTAEYFVVQDQFRSLFTPSQSKLLDGDWSAGIKNDGGQCFPRVPIPQRFCKPRPLLGGRKFEQRVPWHFSETK